MNTITRAALPADLPPIEIWQLRPKERDHIEVIRVPHDYRAMLAIAEWAGDGAEYVKSTYEVRDDGYATGEQQHVKLGTGQKVFAGDLVVMDHGHAYRRTLDHLSGDYEPVRTTETSKPKGRLRDRAYVARARELNSSALTESRAQAFDLLDLFEPTYLNAWPKTKEITEPFGELALALAIRSPGDKQTIEGIQRLLEAMDCALRASVGVWSR